MSWVPPLAGIHSNAARQLGNQEPFLRSGLDKARLAAAHSSGSSYNASITKRNGAVRSHIVQRRTLSLVMVILFDLPVLLSSADTLRMPLASMSKQTLICGTPRGAGGMPDNSNLPSRLLSRVNLRSPS